MKMRWAVDKWILYWTSMLRAIRIFLLLLAVHLLLVLVCAAIGITIIRLNRADLMPSSLRESLKDRTNVLLISVVLGAGLTMGLVFGVKKLLRR